MTGSGLLYGRDSVPVANDVLDFHQLQRENLITFSALGQNTWRGQPTARGIELVRKGFLVDTGPATTPSRGITEGATAHPKYSVAEPYVSRHSEDPVQENPFPVGRAGHQVPCPSAGDTISANREGTIMDLSDLPESALRLIAEAEIEAKYILRKPETSFVNSTGELKLEGQEAEPCPDRDEFSVARNQAALHLFYVTATLIWERVWPDLDALRPRLDAAGKWVDEKFLPDQRVLTDAVAEQYDYARQEVAAEQAGPVLGKRPQSLPRLAPLRVGQGVLKERHQKPYDELLSAAPTPVTLGPSAVPVLSKEPLIFRPEGLTGDAKPIPNGQRKRLSSVVMSPIAARRVEAYIDSGVVTLTEFASKAGTTDRTIRAFRRTGKVRRQIFDGIARAMGTTRESLLKPE